MSLTRFLSMARMHFNAPGVLNIVHGPEDPLNGNSPRWRGPVVRKMSGYFLVSKVQGEEVTLYDPRGAELYLTHKLTLDDPDHLCLDCSTPITAARLSGLCMQVPERCWPDEVGLAGLAPSRVLQAGTRALCGRPMTPEEADALVGLSLRLAWHILEIVAPVTPAAPTYDLDKLQVSAQRVTALLLDRHPGLVTWNTALADALGELRAEVCPEESSADPYTL